MNGKDALAMEEEGTIYYDHDKKEYVPVGRTPQSVIKKERKKRTARRRMLNKNKWRRR
jgi:hypothetical protein